jgi:SUMO ligase MMS21 Smc5/6 complex component
MKLKRNSLRKRRMMTITIPCPILVREALIALPRLLQRRLSIQTHEASTKMLLNHLHKYPVLVTKTAMTPLTTPNSSCTPRQAVSSPIHLPDMLVALLSVLPTLA